MQSLGTKVSKLIRNESIRTDTTLNNVDEQAYRNFVNNIAFALNGEEAEFITSNIEHADEGDGGTIEFAVFTETHVLYGNGNIGITPPSIRLIPRKALSALKVLRAPETVPSTSWRTSDGNASYELTFGEQAQFTLPIDGLDRHDRDTHLNELLPNLLKDLDA